MEYVAFLKHCFIIGAIVVTTGCSPQENSANVYKYPQKCYDRRGEVYSFIGTKECMTYFPKVVIDGIWLLGLEESYFLIKSDGDKYSFDLGGNQPPVLNEFYQEGIWAEYTDILPPQVKYKLTRGTRAVYKVKVESRFDQVKGAFGGGSKFGMLITKVIEIKKIS